MDKDDTPLAFGKHKGKSPSMIADTDPDYILWLYEDTDTNAVSEELYEACANDISEQEDLAGISSGWVEWWKD